MQFKPVICWIFFLLNFIQCCDLEDLFNGKEVSIEEAIKTSQIVFRGFSTPFVKDLETFITYFDLVTVYKGQEILNSWRKLNNYFRKINVTFITKLECLSAANKVPRDYIIFANYLENEIQADFLAIWDENADLRVWTALGWSNWNEWSSCSVSCSSGIQQRTRYCLKTRKCSGFNIQQRFCNLFSCNETLNLLNKKHEKFFHPSLNHWKTVPDRPTAWRLISNSYIWIPAIELFSPNNDEYPQPIFNKDYSLALTLRTPNITLGTIFSLRSRALQHNYLSLEIVGSNLKLIHATDSGTDIIRIPATLDDFKWHQIAFSIRDGTILEVYVDCEWSRTEILLSHSLDVPNDCDIIVGYLFKGDLEQISLIKNSKVAKLQCSNQLIPIDDPDVRYTKNGFKLFTDKKK